MTADDKFVAEHFHFIRVEFAEDDAPDDLADREDLDLVDDDSADVPQQ